MDGVRHRRADNRLVVAASNFGWQAWIRQRDMQATAVLSTSPRVNDKRLEVFEVSASFKRHSGKNGLQQMELETCYGPCRLLGLGLEHHVIELR